MCVRSHVYNFIANALYFTNGTNVHERPIYIAININVQYMHARKSHIVRYFFFFLFFIHKKQPYFGVGGEKKSPRDNDTCVT